jgi:hypothetical protein
MLRVSPDRLRPPDAPYEFIGFGAVGFTKPYEFVGFGDIRPGGGPRKTPSKIFGMDARRAPARWISVGGCRPTPGVGVRRGPPGVITHETVARSVI